MIGLERVVTGRRIQQDNVSPAHFVPESDRADLVDERSQFMAHCLGATSTRSAYELKGIWMSKQYGLLFVSLCSFR